MGVLLEKFKAGAMKKYEKAGDKLAKLSKLTPGQIEDLQVKRDRYLSQMPSADDSAALELTARLIGASSVEVFNSYLSQIKAVYLPEAFDENFNAEKRIRYFDITKWVADVKENTLEKLISVYQVLAEDDCNIALIFNRTTNGTQVQIAVVNIGDDSDDSVAKTESDRIQAAISGNFPGSEISDSKKGSPIKLNNEKKYSVATVSNLATEKSEKFISQTIEKLLDGIIPKEKNGEDEYTIILLATPIHDVESRKARLGDIYTGLAPYASWQTNYTFTESDATNALANFGVNVGVSAGVQAGRNQGINSSQALTDNESKAMTDNTSDMESEGNTHTDNIMNTHTDGTNWNHGTNEGSSDTTGGHGGFEMFGGVNYSHGWNRGTSDSKGGSIADSIAKGTAKTIAKTTAKTIGHAVTNTLGHAVTNTVGKYSGISKGLNAGANLGANFARSSSITATVGCNEGITQSFTNYNIKHLLENLESQMKRLEQSTALGMWDFAAYVLSEDVNIANNVAHMYLALTQGENSYLSHSAINLWFGKKDEKLDKTNENGQAFEINKYISNLQHPRFALNKKLVEDDSTFLIYPLRITPTTNVSGKELAYSLNFPAKSVSGLPVLECAAFGRNISTYGESELQKEINKLKSNLEKKDANLNNWKNQKQSLETRKQILEKTDEEGLKEKIKNITNKIEPKKSKIQDISELKNQLDEINQKIEKQEQYKSALLNDTEKVSEKERLQTEIDDLEHKKKIIDATKDAKKIKEFEKEFSVVKEKQEKIKTLEAEIEQIHKNVEDDIFEIKSLIAKKEEIEKDIKEKYATNKKFFEEIASLEAEKDSVEKELEEYKIIEADFEENGEGYEKKLEDLRTDIDKIEKEKEEIETTLNEKEALCRQEKFSLGKIWHMNHEENSEVQLNLNSLCSHTFITGSTGSGKSNTVYQILDKAKSKCKHFLVIEPAKGEYKNVFGNSGDVSVYGTNPSLTPLLKINPFSFPKEIHILEHLDRLVEIFNVCWPMYAAMPAVLKEAVEKSYEDAGWDLTASTNPNGELYPTFADVAQNVKLIIDTSEYDAENKGAYKGSLLTRLKSLTNGLNGQIFTNKGIEDLKLFDENVIIDLSRVGSQETKSLLMGVLVFKLQEHRMAKGGMNSDLKHITVLEEAHNLLKRTSTEQVAESANLVGKSVEMLTNAIAEMRTYGEGFIIADQAPALLDMAVIRNTNTKIIMRLPDLADRELVGKAANLNDDQITELAKLPTGVAAVYQNEWVEAVLCKVEHFKTSETSYKDEPSKDNSDDGTISISNKIEIAKLLSNGEKLSEAEAKEKLDAVNISFIARGIAIEYLQNPPAEPRMTKLAPIMSALFPKSYNATKYTCSMNQGNPSLWTNDIQNILNSEINKAQVDAQVQRDIIQALITQYVFNELHQAAKLEDWAKHNGFKVIL